MEEYSSRRRDFFHGTFVSIRRRAKRFLINNKLILSVLRHTVAGRLGTSFRDLTKSREASRENSLLFGLTADPSYRRRMPRALMREETVEGGRPNRAETPLAPEIFHLHVSSARSRLPFSNCSTSAA